MRRVGDDVGAEADVGAEEDAVGELLEEGADGRGILEGEVGQARGGVHGEVGEALETAGDLAHVVLEAAEVGPDHAELRQGGGDAVEVDGAHPR